MAKPLSCIFLPYQALHNPYQARLARALNAHGVIVNSPGEAPLLDLMRARLRGQLDLVHFHWTSPLLLSSRRGKSILKTGLFLVTSLALKASGARLVWTLHNLLGHERADPRLEIFANRILCRLCDQIIVHCPHAIELALETYRLPLHLKGKISIIPHAHFIDEYPNHLSPVEARECLGLPAMARIFLYFGAIRPYKNVDGLIEAFQQLEAPGTYLLVAGKPHNPSISSQIQGVANAHQRIQARLAFIPREEIQTYMNAADVVALPFKDILTSSSVILAMSFAKAVITPALGCNPHILRNQPQLLYGPQQKAGLIKTMQASLTMDLEEIGQANQAAIRKFPWELVGQKTYALYRRCFAE